MKKQDFVYFIQIGEDDRIFKIGTTNDIDRRMKEHKRYFKKPIKVLWVSPAYSKYTTLRVEDDTKNLWRETTNWEYIRNDRFRIPEDVTEVRIKVRKEYVVSLI